NRVRWSAMLHPTMPAPTITTLAFTSTVPSPLMHTARAYGGRRPQNEERGRVVSGQESETLHPNEGAVRRSTHEGGPRFLLRMAKPSLITQQYHAVAAAVKGLHLQFQEISS